tara:strand:- start:44 stop:418 length:375 start_codon:yes stop_codon:yes gene_type:complete
MKTLLNKFSKISEVEAKKVEAASVKLGVNDDLVKSMSRYDSDASEIDKLKSQLSGDAMKLIQKISALEGSVSGIFKQRNEVKTLASDLGVSFNDMKGLTASNGLEKSIVKYERNKKKLSGLKNL